MQIQNLDTILQEALLIEDQKTLLSIEHESAYLTYLKERISKNLREGKKTLLFSSEERHQKVLSKLIASLGLEAWHFQLSNNEVATVDVARIKSKIIAADQHTTHRPTEENSYTAYETSLRQKYSSIHQVKYAGSSLLEWAQKVDLNTDIPNIYSFQMAIQNIPFSYDKDELSYYSRTLQNAGYLYHPEFKSYYYSPLRLNESIVIQNKNSKNVLKTWAKTSAELLEKLSYNLLIKHKEGNIDFHRIPIQNCGPLLRENVDAIHSFYEEINQSNLLLQKIEDNAFNISKSYEKLRTVVDQLAILSHFTSQDPSILDWIRFKSDLNPNERAIVEAFESCYSNYQKWDEIFQIFYVQNIFKKAINGSYNRLTAQLETYKESIQTANIASLKQLKAEHDEILGKVIKEKYLQSLIASFTKYKTEAIQITVEELGKTPLFTTMFPIISTSDIDLARSLEHIDDIIFLQTNDASIRNDKVVREDTPITYVFHPSNSFVEKQYKEFEQKQLLKDYTIMDEQWAVERSSDYDLIKALNTHLQNYKEEAFYMTKGSLSLLGFLSKPVAEMVVSFYESLGWKHVIINSFSNLTYANVFHDKRHQGYLLTVDGLIKPQDFKTARWQMMLVDRIKQLGWKHLDVSHELILKTGESAFYIEELHHTEKSDTEVVREQSSGIH